MTERKYVSIYTREHLTERLIWFRDEFKEKIPARIIHSDEPDNRFKVRTAWFVGLAADLEVSKIEGILPNSIIEDVDKFLLWYSTDFGDKPGYPKINTKEDIEKGNAIINKVLESLGERKCGYKIVAFVDGKKEEVTCNPVKGCLRDLVWSGIGLPKAAAQNLGKDAKGIEAWVEGDCGKSVSSE